MRNLVYAGIGARNTPANILASMTASALFLDTLGYILRSGGAKGADTAFEAGATHKEIYLPWKGFNGNTSPLHYISISAYQLAARYHPRWDRCGETARKFHGRNSHQICGRSMEILSDFVLCWTPNGLAEGGTGQAIRIAQAFNIPVINMQHTSWKQQIREVLGEV